MKKILISILAAAVGMAAQAQSDTLRLSSLYTTHIIFPSELSYVDVSNKAITAKVVDNSKNILAIKARYKFDYCTTISALESDGRMNTYIVIYDESPKELVIDRRIDERKADKATTASDSKESKTPQAQEILKQRRKLFHLSDSKYKMTVACEDLFVCNDITYFVLSVENRSGISYDCADAGFVIESRKN